MAQMDTYRVKIDQLPEETIEARDPNEAAHKVGVMIRGHETLRKLHDEEPVQIKRPDGRPWGRNLTVGAFRNKDVDVSNDEPDGPVHPASV